MARIAVVDDSKLARVFAVAALQKHGHEVFEIEPDSLDAVLKALIEWKPDLMILDYAMPGFQGPSLVRACVERPELSEMKVMMLTAFHDEAVAARMRKLGVGTILHKPIRHEDLARSIDSMLQDPAG